MPQRSLRQLQTLRARRDTEVRALVAKAVKAGASSAAIAHALGVSRSTLWRHYGDELQRHRERP